MGFVPRELTRWKQKMQGVCQKLKARQKVNGVKPLPGVELFRPDPSCLSTTVPPAEENGRVESSSDVGHQPPEAPISSSSLPASLPLPTMPLDATATEAQVLEADMSQDASV